MRRAISSNDPLPPLPSLRHDPPRPTAPHYAPPQSTTPHCTPLHAPTPSLLWCGEREEKDISEAEEQGGEHHVRRVTNVLILIKPCLGIGGNWRVIGGGLEGD